MINYTGQECNRNSMINGEFISRDLNGNKVNLIILRHEGNVARLVDDKGFHYELPEDLKVTVEVIEEYFVGKVEIDNEAPVENKREFSLKQLFEANGSNPIGVFDYLGKLMTINIKDIRHASYGWPSQQGLSLIEGSLVIKT